MPGPFHSAKRLSLAIIAATCLMTAPLRAAAESYPEELLYSWKLSGFKGVVARIFIPGTGEGTLITKAGESGALVSELRISSPSARNGDYWLYGSEIDADERRTLRAWSSQQFRGEARAKESELEGDDVVDLASSIFFLRRELPDQPTEAHIWSSGRIHRVEVRPGERDDRIIGGRSVATRAYSLRGVGKPAWRGKLDLVLAEDEAATPLEITLARDGMRVHLELVEPES